MSKIGGGVGIKWTGPERVEKLTGVFFVNFKIIVIE